MPTSLDIIETYSDEVEHIIYKIRHKKDRYDLLRWLDNFSGDDKLSALEILKRLVFVDEEQLHVEVDNLIKKLEEETPHNSFYYFYPVAKYGKSATLVSYYFKHSPKFVALEKQKRVVFLSNDSEINTAVIYESDVLVLFDDFLGTGGSFKESYDHFATISSPKFTVNSYQFALSVYRMETAESNIKAVYPYIKFLGNLHPKLFGLNPAMFNPTAEIMRQKQLATDYARTNSLFFVKETPHHLGYMDSQALISFAYKPPNNTLPIIWAAKKSGWRPFLPRYESEIYGSVQDYKENLLIAAAKLEFGVSKGKILDNELYHLPLVLSMLKRKTSIPLIAVIIGISVDDLTKILEKGIKQGLLIRPATITEKGLKTIADAEKTVANIKAEQKEKTNVENLNIKYMSKTVSRK